MHTLKFAAALFATQVALGTGPAVAAESADESSAPSACAVVPRDHHTSETELRTQVEKLGFQVVRVRDDAGCRGVLADDRDGKPNEVKFRGTDQRTVERHEGKGAR